jgi:isoquinoline 1-oxidoreductase beta subunit
MSAPPSRGRRLFLEQAALVLMLPVMGRVTRVGSASAGAAGLPPVQAFLRIQSDESVRVLLAHAEMGQGVWTALPMLIAEELGCEMSALRVEHAPSDAVYAHPSFGFHGTGGSSSVSSELVRYRQVGAMAREMLLRAAAKRWQVGAARCRVERGHVLGPAGQRLSFGALVADAAALRPPASVRLKPRREWSILGRPQLRLDSREKVTGAACFGIDQRLPGMRTAVIARAPAFGARLSGYRAERARAVAGVHEVLTIPQGVAVVADHFYAARLGRDALELDWQRPTPQLDSRALWSEYRALARAPGQAVVDRGDAERALGAAARVLEAEYVLPYIAHAPMEPLNCTVRLARDATGWTGCEIWTGTQWPGQDQQLAARLLGIEPDRVTVHTCFLGGSFGRRATPESDFVVEAVEVAKAAQSRAPIRVVWTREDELCAGYYRPMWLHRVRVGVDAAGLPLAWLHRAVGHARDEDIISGSPYLERLAHLRLERPVPAKNPVPLLWWRAPGHNQVALVLEGIIDELAQAAGVDPLEYRKRLLAKSPRHLAVLDAAAKRAGWGRAAAGRFQGVAVHESFGSVVAHVVEVSVEGGRPRVHRVVSAVDCGLCINPSGVVAQIESAIVLGLSAALKEEITLEGSAPVQRNFHTYRVLRLPEMPEVVVTILPGSETPGGVGETGLPPVAPALGNALFAATGQRLRRLPFRLA